MLQLTTQFNIVRSLDNHHNGHKPGFPIKVQAVVFDDKSKVYNIAEVVTDDDPRKIHNAVRRLSSLIFHVK